jgi:hypothetical protein
MTNTERLIIDYANLSPATAQLLGDGQLPPLPIIQGPMWLPPSQTAPSGDGTLPGRLKIYANADSHDWQEYVPDVPSPTGGGTLMNYWDGGPPANYVLVMRSYWSLVSNTYTQIYPGGSFTKEYSTTVGISTTDAQTISAEMGFEAEGLGAKLSAEFSHSVTTSSSQTETTTYNVGAPADGLIRVWMLWQLVDEIVALDPNTGNVVANPTRTGDVNWSQHAPSGAYLQYTNLDQLFPESFLVPVQKDFPNSTQARGGDNVGRRNK